MARTVRDTSLESRAARLKLKISHKPYYRVLDQGCHLGYRKGTRSGTWRARLFIGNGKYKETTVGIADDTQDADGIQVLSFRQAQEKARAWFSEQARSAAGIEAIKPKTVREATAEYLEWFKSHRKTYTFTKQSIDLYILPEFGDTLLHNLSSRKIQTWLNAMAESQPRARRKLGEKDNFRSSPSEPRQRKATANRHLTMLKAILNHAFRHGYVLSDIEWKRVRPFQSVDAPKIRYLTEAECARLINACLPDFRELVQGALYTGARYGELIVLHVSDFNPDSHTVHVRDSKSGKPRYIALSQAGVDFFAHVTAGKSGSDMIFTKANGTSWKRAHQKRPIAEASDIANISPRSRFHDLRHTYASQLAMQGVSLQVIAAQLGHADTRICERHYAHLSPSYISDTIKKNLPDLGYAIPGKVQAFKRSK